MKSIFIHLKQGLIALILLTSCENFLVIRDCIKQRNRKTLQKFNEIFINKSRNRKIKSLFKN